VPINSSNKPVTEFLVSLCPFRTIPQIGHICIHPSRFIIPYHPVIPHAAVHTLQNHPTKLESMCYIINQISEPLLICGWPISFCWYPAYTMLKTWSAGQDVEQKLWPHWYIILQGVRITTNIFSCRSMWLNIFWLTAEGIKVYLMSDHSGQQIVVLTTIWWWQRLGRD
jgi:hypothetical protein